MDFVFGVDLDFLGCESCRMEGNFDLGDGVGVHRMQVWEIKTAFLWRLKEQPQGVKKSRLTDIVPARNGRYATQSHNAAISERSEVLNAHLCNWH
jgi:hypothetical protein